MGAQTEKQNDEKAKGLAASLQFQKFLSSRFVFCV